jgi:hypothetical protein
MPALVAGRHGGRSKECSSVRLARTSIAGALLVVALAGCGSSHRSAQQPATSPAGSTAPVSSSATAPGTVAPASHSAGTPSPSQPSIPPYLCEATDQAENAADAYMGALSAGNQKQAVACVLPGTVPAAVTRSLLATVKGTAVYLPRAGVDGPQVFGYRGNGKSIDVTVTKQSDGRFWVIRVVVRGG